MLATLDSLPPTSICISERSGYIAAGGSFTHSGPGYRPPRLIVWNSGKGFWGTGSNGTENRHTSGLIGLEFSFFGLLARVLDNHASSTQAHDESFADFGALPEEDGGLSKRCGDLYPYPYVRDVVLVGPDMYPFPGEIGRAHV